VAEKTKYFFVFILSYTKTLDINGIISAIGIYVGFVASKCSCNASRQKKNITASGFYKKY
jgi:hypothetical protein